VARKEEVQMSEAAVEAPADSDVSEDRVAELVSSLTVEELEPVIAEAGPNKLAAIAAAEASGKERKGVLDAVEARQRALEEDGVSAEADVPEEPSWADAPVESLIPLIAAGHWVRFKSAMGVPKHAVGRDGVVTFAASKMAPGQDTISDGAYTFQDGSEVFSVRLRDTGEVLTVTRAAFASFDTEQARLGAA
jgi:hypothetical protein